MGEILPLVTLLILQSGQYFFPLGKLAAVRTSGGVVLMLVGRRRQRIAAFD